MKKSLIILSGILMVFCLLSCDSKISHAEHVWGGQKVTKAATCTEEGEAVVKCSCGETKTITLEKLGHDIVEEVTEPSYLKKGRIDYKCSRCDATDLKKSFELDRLSLAGYGFEKYTEDDTYGYYDFLFFEEDNIVNVIGGSFTLSSEIWYPSFFELNYLIKEKQDAEGNATYYFSVITPYGIMEYPVSEVNGKLVVSDFYYDGEDYVDIKLENGVHKHSGVVKNYVSDDDIEKGVLHYPSELCQYFICDSGCTIGGRTTEFIVKDQHMYDKAGNKCINCGATLPNR